jgi:glycopeptide antibiotics resistance protein
MSKLVVVLPVFAIGFIYLSRFYEKHYANNSDKRIKGFIISVALFYLFVVVITLWKKQRNVLQMMVQSSFFVYVLAVLILTCYFILFREVSSVDWWESMMHRIRTNDRVNLKPFRIFQIYDREDMQILGNLAMLFPLGIYLPILIPALRRSSGFFPVLFICLISSLLIEMLQLATRFRSADIDDVILNVCGGCAGFMLYNIIRKLITRRKVEGDEQPRTIV